MAHNDTEQDGEDATDAAPLARFEAGQRAHDRESDGIGEVLVLGATGTIAEECYVVPINQTVAEANPEYPASDPVADVAFVESIENAMGIDWSADDVLQLYADGGLDRARIMAYVYPESRLAPVEENGDER